MEDQFLSVLLEQQPKTKDDLTRLKRRFSKERKIEMIADAKILAAYKNRLQKNEIEKNPALESLLKRRAIRTLSGVAPITILTKPYACPGKCVYCPTEPNMPKSYLSNEPAAMRAVGTQFDPYKGVHVRIRALEDNGHDADKMELIVLGGTWSAYPLPYQTWYVKEALRAANDYPEYIVGDPDPSVSGQEISEGILNAQLEAEQKRNETAKYRFVGTCLETRPDWVDDSELKRLRFLGCTRIQLGVQSVYNDVLDLIKRGHSVEDLTATAKKFRDAGFKIDFHIMPNLPGSNLARDEEMFRILFENPAFRPDQMKIYPCVVNEYAELYSWWQQGKFHPYTDEENAKLLVAIKKLIPSYVRLNRLIRDIPGESIIAGNKITNLREMLQKEMDRQGVKCKCIRCREARNQTTDLKNAKLFIDEYEAAGGREFFINYANEDRSILYAFVRLRLPDKKESASHPIEEIRNAALIRELHTFGQLVPLAENSQAASQIQHEGFGKRLMREAEHIAAENGFEKVSTIAGVGVRGYYKMLGYELEGTYMNKRIGGRD